MCRVLYVLIIICKTFVSIKKHEEKKKKNTPIAFVSVKKHKENEKKTHLLPKHIVWALCRCHHHPRALALVYLMPVSSLVAFVALVVVASLVVAVFIVPVQVEVRKVTVTLPSAT